MLQPHRMLHPHRMLFPFALCAPLVLSCQSPPCLIGPHRGEVAWSGAGIAPSLASQALSTECSRTLRCCSLLQEATTLVMGASDIPDDPSSEEEEEEDMAGEGEEGEEGEMSEDEDGTAGPVGGAYDFGAALA